MRHAVLSHQNDDICNKYSFRSDEANNILIKFFFRFSNENQQRKHILAFGPKVCVSCVKQRCTEINMLKFRIKLKNW